MSELEIQTVEMRRGDMILGIIGIHGDYICLVVDIVPRCDGSAIGLVLLRSTGELLSRMYSPSCYFRIRRAE